MEVVDLNVVGYYYYKPDIEISNYVETEKIKECIICKKSIFESSYETVSNNKNILNENEISIGKCGHIFHKDCIDCWLQSCNTCPIDKVTWYFYRNIDTTTNLVLEKSNKKIENNIKTKYKNSLLKNFKLNKNYKL